MSIEVNQGEAIVNAYEDDPASLRTSLASFTATLLNGILTASNTGANLPFDVSYYQKKTIYVSTTTNCNISVKGGATEDTMHFLKTGSAATEDEDLLWNCNAEMIAFPIDAHLNYIQIIVDETGAADSTIRVEITGG